MALQLYNAANAAAAPNQNPVLLTSGQTLAQYCHNNLQLTLLVMPGNDVAYVRGRITPAQVRTMRSSCINALLIQSRGVLVEGSCGECRRRGLTPFPDCRRVQDHFGNSCGNCKWRDHGIRCVRSDRPCAGPAGRGCKPPPPPRASPDRIPTAPPSADPKSSGVRKGPLLLGSGSAEEPLVVDKPLSLDTSSTNVPTITSSNSNSIPVLDTSNIKSSETKSSPAIDEVDNSTELSAAAQLSIGTPSKIEPSTKKAVNMPSIITEATASSVIPLIDLDKWVSSPDFVATYSSTSSSIPVVKSETDTDKKPQLKVEEDLKIPVTEMKSCEEEERRQETELEDAIRIAEARKELHRVRRKIETLRSGSL